MCQRETENRLDTCAFAVRRLNRLDTVGETLRAALNRLATIAPDWLNEVVADEWYDRYGRRIEDYRLPKEKEARSQFAKTIGEDGLTLLDAIYAPSAPESLKQLDEVEILRQTWVEQFFVLNEMIQLRDAKDLPPAQLRLESPYDPEARYSSKGSSDWVGYKVHITETCHADTPHSRTCVQTTAAPVQDVTMTPVIHEQLAHNSRLPTEHFADAGYVSAEMLVNSQKEHQVQLVGPAKADGSWQAKQNAGYSLDQFDIDFEHQCVTCPQGATTTKWRVRSDQRGKPVIHAKFHRSTCQECQARRLRA